MTARVAALFTLCMLTTGAAMAPAALEVTPARTACREAIAQLETVTRTESTVPDWELGEAWGWHATARPRSTLARFHIPFVPEWLETVWTAMRSVLQQASAWSRSLLFSDGRRSPERSLYPSIRS
jgi:hypothetical protein